MNAGNDLRDGRAAGDPGGSEPRDGHTTGDPGVGDLPDALAARWPGGGDLPAASADADSDGVDADLPDLSADGALDAALEALLLVVDAPTEDEVLATALGQPVARVRLALRRLTDSYAGTDRGIDLRKVGLGWRFYTRDAYAPFVERLLHDGHHAKLTRAALETLAVVAYRQPVTRARVAAVRGVNCDGVLRTLLARGLVAEAGMEPSTQATLFCTTEVFLERLGLAALDELPSLAPLLPDLDSIDEL